MYTNIEVRHGRLKVHLGSHGNQNVTNTVRRQSVAGRPDCQSSVGGGGGMEGESNSPMVEKRAVAGRAPDILRSTSEVPLSRTHTHTTHPDTSPSTIVLGQMKLNLTVPNLGVFFCQILCFTRVDFPAFTHHGFGQVTRNSQAKNTDRAN